MLQLVDGWSADGIRRGLDQALEHYGLDSIPLVYLHDPDDREQEVRETAWPALSALREQGVVRAIGVGMNQWQVLTRFVADLDVDVVLAAGVYNLLDASALDELIPTCVQRGTSVVVGGVLGTGILADDDTSGRYGYHGAPAGIVDRVQGIRTVCREYEVPMASAAMQYPLRDPAVSSILVGMRSPQEVDQNVESFEHDVPTSLWEDLVSRGLIRANG